MTVLPAKHHAPGVQHFYVKSDSGHDYVVTHVRRDGQRRWFCDCPDFTFRRLAIKKHCKHVHQLAEMARLAGGVSRLVALASVERAA
ncbi:MAG: hypothetical protein WBD73_10165 [Candidatus Acidiferrales bacterium]